jgi:Rieske 2Fe-2S family protein
MPVMESVRTRFLLSPDAYTSAAWFDREQRELFTRRWALVAHVEQLRDPGDWLAVNVGLAPVLLVRHPDGELRAFHNLCRHRGMVLLEGRGHTDEIGCFYHGWRYDLGGELRVVPQRRAQFPDLDPSTCGLLPAAVEAWEGLVFVHPDPAAPPLAETLGGLPERIGSHRPGQLTLVATADVPATCNWKLLVENHIDVYHLWYLHRESLGDFDHHRFEHELIGPNWVSYEPLRAADLEAARLTRGTVTITHLEERDRLGVGAHLVFPNLLMAANAEFFMTYAVVPDAADRSHVEVRIRAEPGADGAALVEAARSFIDEDVRACEQIQTGLRSPWFAVGPLAQTHEAPITAFHRHLLDALDAPPDRS